MWQPFTDRYKFFRPVADPLASAVAENQRQAIAGDGGGTVLNRHYTAHHTEDLKTAIDRADFKVEIVYDDWRGFPVIRASTLTAKDRLSVQVVLNDKSTAESIRVYRAGSPDYVFAFERRDALTGDQVGTPELRLAAKNFRKLCADNAMRMPTHKIKRLAVEHFQALA